MWTLLRARPPTIRCALRPLPPRERKAVLFARSRFPSPFLHQRHSYSDHTHAVLDNYYKLKLNEPTERRVSPDHLRHLIRDGTATTDNALACLYFLKEDLLLLPVEQRLEKCRRIGIGGHVLHWLMGLTTTKGTPRDHPMPLQILLPWFLLAESLEPFMLEWLELLSSKRLSNDEARRMRGYIKGMGMARYAWSDGSPDSVLEYHVNLRRLAREHHLSKYIRQLWMHGLECLLMNILYRDECPPADVNLYEEFALSPTFEASHICRLSALYHPTQPNAEKFFQLCQGRDISDHRIGNHDSSQSFRRCLRAAYILRAQGRVENARWLESKVETKAPAIWQDREDIYASIMKDPKLAGLRSLETSKARSN